MKLLALVLTLCALTGVACMSVPPGTTILVTDSPEALCNQRVNCYHAPSRTIVLVPGQSLKTLAHEGCHAHQHATVLDELGREPRTDLTDWYETSEAEAYAAVVEAAPRPADWRMSADNLLEDFAEACGRYMAQDPRWPGEPSRDAFFEARDFR